MSMTDTPRSPRNVMAMLSQKLNGTSDEVKGLNQQEERELRRVFDHLANHVPRKRVNERLAAKTDRKTFLRNAKKNGEPVLDDEGNAISDDVLAEELQKLVSEVEELNRQLTQMETNANKKIHPQDLSEGLKALGKRCSRKEIEYMIWEVDENLDGCVNWDEFRLMFQRNVTDTSGLEPFQLFNIVQFMTYDKDFSGKVTVDDTMSMLYARYGRDQLETQMKILFGDNLKSDAGDGKLSITDYLRAVNVRKPRRRKGAGSR